jgi:cysteinyl-tRNA synthetase
LKAAVIAIERLRNFKLRLDTDKFPVGVNEALLDRTNKAAQAFRDGLNEDLNTAEALAAVFEYVRDVNSAMDASEFRTGNTAPALAFLTLFDSIFEVLTPTAKAGELSDSAINGRIAARDAAKKSKNFALADQIRDELLQQDIVLEDTRAGVRWKRK